MKVVGALIVSDPALFSAIDAVAPTGPYLVHTPSPTERWLRVEFAKQLPALAEAGLAVLEQPAQAPPTVASGDLGAAVAALPRDAMAMLWRAQRYAEAGVVRGDRVWDPEHDAAAVRALAGAGLVAKLDPDELGWAGGIRLAAGLPDPPAARFDAADAVMPRTDDLAPSGKSVVELLHDLAALAAALRDHPPRRTHAGGLDRVTVRKLGRRLGVEGLAADGDLGAFPRWTQAFGALEALGAVTMDPATRTLSREPGVEALLRGPVDEVIDRLLRRLVEPDLRPGLDVVREALRQADGGALDTMVLDELLCEQRRDLFIAPWWREGQAVYPCGPEEVPRPYDADGFERIEGRLLRRLYRVLLRLGLVERAPGVVAATADGRLWACGAAGPMPPIWVDADLSVTVPPGSLTPWQRYVTERVARCMARDVVDVYRLDRDGLAGWLRAGEVGDVLALLAERSPAVPAAVREALVTWDAALRRIVWRPGLLWGEEPPVSA